MSWDSKGWVSGRNIKESIGKAHGKSTMVEKGIYEIGRLGRLRKQNEDGVNSRKVGTRIRERSHRWVMGLRNVDERWTEKIEKCIAEGR
jgi:hypothetical protein